jgi:hypothetical protein
METTGPEDRYALMNGPEKWVIEHAGSLSSGNVISMYT